MRLGISTGSASGAVKPRWMEWYERGTSFGKSLFRCQERERKPTRL